MNIAISFILFLLTSLIIYSIWYIIRGHSRKGNANASQEQIKENPIDAKGKGIPKDSYCYPKINEVMGYDFISVVQVAQELLEDTPPEEQKKWDETEGIGGLKTLTKEDSKIINEDEPWLDDDQESKATSRKNQQKPNDDTPENSIEDEYETVEASVKPDELEEISRLSGIEWGNRNYEDELPDDYINATIDNNPDMIESGEPSEKDLRIAREKEALALEQNFIEAMSNPNNEGGSILDELEEYEQNDKNQESTTIDPNDIPEI